MSLRKKPEPWAARLGTSALDPLQVMDLQEAIRKRAKTALVGGVKFKLSYKKDGTVFYQPAEEGKYSPCGYLDIERFMEGT